MDNRDTVKIVTNGLLIRLSSVKYSRLPDPKNSELLVDPTDSFNLQKLTKEYFEIKVSRKIEFEPRKLFCINVEALASFHIDSEKTNPNFENREQMEAYLIDHLEEFVEATPIYSGISLIISQITSAFGEIPLISPSNLLKKD